MRASANGGPQLAEGATVKVGEFVGKVFWRGVTQYRSAFSARLGVKDSKGATVWCAAEEAAPL